MYFFVRFMGIVAVVVGVVLMFLGFGAAVYGFVQNAALVDLANRYLLVGQNAQVVDVRFYAALLGLALFLMGMFSAGWGQLMLAFADVAANTNETNAILRSMRKVE